MGKGQDSKKATKKAPTKTAKEKKAEKRLKKANREWCKLEKSSPLNSILLFTSIKHYKILLVIK